MLLAYAAGGVADITLTVWDVTFEDFVAAMSTPEIGAKDGAYWVRGGRLNGSNERADANILAADMAVLDGDSTVDMLTGTICKGAPAPHLVHEVLKFADIPHVIYTSHSNAPGQWRYRVCLPVLLGNQEELAAAVDWTIHLLHENQVQLASVPENYRWSQPWYTPRVPSEHAGLFRAYVHDSEEVFPLAQAIAWWRERQPPQPEVPTGASVARDPDSPIGKFVASHGAQWMADLLDEHGYILAGTSKGKAGLVYRFLAPLSTTGQPGCCLFEGDAGKWVVYSHHGEADPLSGQAHHGGKALDCFDLLVHLAHGGDADAAIGAVMDEQLDAALKALADDVDVLDPAAPMLSARRMLERHFTREGQAVLVHWGGDFHQWTGTHYRTSEEAAVRARVWRFLAAARVKAKGKLKPFHPNRARVADVMDALRAVAHLDRHHEPPCWLEPNERDPREMMACANGLLHLPSRDLHPQTPVFFSLNARPFGYDPAAPRPERWLHFLHEEVWPGDRQSVETLQEVFGYALTPDTRQQKAFLVVGPRRSGKGTIARVLTAMLGKENVAAPTLASLGQNFGLQPLIGKSLAVISDARLGRRTDAAVVAERLLSISGEDALTVDRKFREPWTGALQVRFLVMTNELPRLSDASGALASRFLVLVMQESFYGREDPKLTGKLLEELPGILNWAIEGWERLTERGCFVQPDSAREAVAELEALSSDIGAFLKERCEVGPYTVSVDHLWLEWQAWCQRQGREHAGTRQTFGRDLRAALPVLRIVQPRDGDERFRAYEGLRLRP